MNPVGGYQEMAKLRKAAGPMAGRILDDLADPMDCLEDLRKSLGADRATLLLFRPMRTRGLLLVNSDGVDDILPMDITDCFCGRVRRQDAPLLITDTEHHAPERCCNYMRAEEIRSYLGVPVRNFAGLTIACAAILCRAPRRWKDAEVGFAHRTSARIARALALRATLDQTSRRPKSRRL